MNSPKDLLLRPSAFLRRPQKIAQFSSSWFWQFFKKRQNHEEDCANFWGLLRKAELYVHKSFLWDGFCLCSFQMGQFQNVHHFTAMIHFHQDFIHLASVWLLNSLHVRKKKILHISVKEGFRLGRYSFLLCIIMSKNSKDLWFYLLIESSLQHLLRFFDMIKPKWKKYLSSQ